MQGNPEFKKLRSGWPKYLDDMDKMFTGVAIDGSTSYIPGQSDFQGADEPKEQEEEDPVEDMDLQSPVSTSSRKRASSNSTDLSINSPGKKKGAAMRIMKDYVSVMTKNRAERNQYFRQVCTEKQQLIQ